MREAIERGLGTGVQCTRNERSHLHPRELEVGRRAWLVEDGHVGHAHLRNRCGELSPSSHAGLLKK